MFFPNSFTPDGDNCNDEFYLSGLGDFLDFNLEIYNRWGEMVFESNEIIFTDNFSYAIINKLKKSNCIVFTTKYLAKKSYYKSLKKII